MFQDSQPENNCNNYGGRNKPCSTLKDKSELLIYCDSQGKNLGTICGEQGGFSGHVCNYTSHNLKLENIVKWIVSSTENK